MPQSRYEIRALPPFRLDLTVNVLRRVPSNVVDVLTGDNRYLRAFGTPHGAVVACVEQLGPDRLVVTLEGDARAHPRVLDLVRRVLGVDRNLEHFYRAATRIRWLNPLARRMRGVKPPRYPTVWEACVNAVVFQQISIRAASTIVRRLIDALAGARHGAVVPVYEFPPPSAFLSATASTLRGVGLSRSKIATLRRVADALETGGLDPDQLEEMPSGDAAKVLRGIKGIGPWSASLILLRGLGRLDVFPGNDAGVLSNLALVAGHDAGDLDSVLEALSPQQGMLYYHLLLARLESRGELGRASGEVGEPPGGRGARRGSHPSKRAAREEQAEMIRIKRTYDPPARDDGQRFLVERLWPRGMKKEELVHDGWLKDVAPSTELRKWFGHRVERWPEFEQRYRKELDARPEAWQPILDAAKRGNVTLLYSARDTEHNGAIVLRDYLESRIGGRTKGKRS
ncbi:MAG TPA: DUF488 family protein [Longimicrobiales bacterium]|nr:DUF488 family protein [Longimicrobiales bacterium]